MKRATLYTVRVRQSKPLTRWTYAKMVCRHRGVRAAKWLCGTGWLPGRVHRWLVLRVVYGAPVLPVVTDCAGRMVRYYRFEEYRRVWVSAGSETKE